MFKTTIYLPEELKRRLERLARRAGRSEASLIREALEHLAAKDSPRPRPALFRSGDPHLAERVDEALKGFGD
jgi:metal-responsive CopG/Arc/MetJ family transcriptional regulator